MAERSRLELLKQMGVTALQGLKAAVTGVDVVIDPNEPPEPSEGPSQAGGDVTSPPAPPPEEIGTTIGRRAMAAAEHRVGSAARVTEGAALATTDLLEGVGLTLAVYPGPGTPLLEQSLGLTGTILPVDGDPEIEATAHDLAWLPLTTGAECYGRGAGGELIAVGGYRRAALVRFTGAPAGAGTWCVIGDDAISGLLPADARGQLLLEHPEKLARALQQGRVGLALLGGELLAQALSLPGAAVETELPADAELGLVPAWGLFSAGRAPEILPADDAHVRIVPTRSGVVS